MEWKLDNFYGKTMEIFTNLNVKKIDFNTNVK